MPINSLDHLMRKTTDGSITSVDWQFTTNRVCVANRWNDAAALNTTGPRNTFPGTALTWVDCNSSSSFALPIGQAVEEASGFSRHLIFGSAVSAAAAAVPGVLMLVDLQGYWPGLTNVTSPQTLSGTPTLRYPNGEGLKLYPVVTTVTGAGTPTLSLSYTNQAGTPDRNLSHALLMGGSVPVHTIYHYAPSSTVFGASPFLPLAGGDTGVQNVTSVTMSAATAGAFALCLAKPLITIPIVQVSSIVERDFVTQLTSVPRIYNGACLTWLYYSGAATLVDSNIYGSLEMVWG